MVQYLLSIVALHFKRKQIAQVLVSVNTLYPLQGVKTPL